MKLGVCIYSNDSESVWNAFRFSNFALKKGDEVKVFLLGKGVECESIDSEKFKVTEQLKDFIDGGGKVLACGGCLKMRQQAGSETCPLSTMEDLYRIIQDSDRTVSF